jgi:ABC-type glycerol-3-phosphate transport system substrate-binding protein
MRAAVLLVLLVASLGLVACGGDDEPEQAETTPPTAAESTPPPATAVDPETETTEDEAATTTGEGADISRVDAEQETARQSMLVAEDVPNSDLYFADADDVECEAPGATQPDNANERAAEWTCTIDAETNGVACQGTARIVAAPGANPGKTFEGLEAQDVDIDCRPA